MPTLSLGTLFPLIGEIASMLDRAGIHLPIRQLVLIAIVWFRQKNAYEVKLGVIFFTPRGVPQVLIHDYPLLQRQISDLIEERLSIKPR